MAETGKKAKTAASPRKPNATKAKTVNGAAATPAAGPRMVSHDEIRALAHRYWAERGHAHGNPEDDWFRAEQELRGKAS